MKCIRYIFVTLTSFVLFSAGVEAASVSIKSNYYTITKGGSVTVTATVSSDSPIVSIEGTLMCKGAGASTGVSMEFDDVSNSLYSKSYSSTIKSTSSGTITCTVSGARITSMASDSWQNISDKSISITVKEPAYVPPKTYSSNNYLKVLEVEGYAISPEFNKDTLEYSVEVPNGTEIVNIVGSTEDSKASVSGTGEISVNEGTNKIEVKVTAENGNEKVYVINVTVKELDPIEVKVDGKKYNIIRKEGILEVPENYEKSSIKVGDEDVLCYKNIVTENILIGLKDEEGNSRYYSYNEKTNKYILYNGYKIGSVNLNILSMPSGKLPDGYSKVSFEYNDNKIDGYQYIDKGVTYAADDSVKGNDFYLIYAVNELSGEEGLYVYDKLEGTVQRFNNTLALPYQEKAETYFLYLLIAILLLALTIITFMIVSMKKKKHKHKFS